MIDLTAFFRAFCGYCPTCNSDAPQTCQTCLGWRGEFPPKRWLTTTWLMRHFTMADSRTDGIEKANDWMIANGFKSNRWTARLLYDYTQSREQKLEHFVQTIAASQHIKAAEAQALLDEI